MAEMNQRDTQALKHFLPIYQHQWQLNQYFRDGYDEDLEYYLGYRDEQRYPLAYNIRFNKLMPRVMQVMSRLMGQLYQPNTNDLVAVRPRKRGDVDRSSRVEGLLNFQLETLNDIDMQGGSYWHNFQWLFSAVAWGKGICKLYWRQEERITPRRMQIPTPQFDPYGRLIGMGMQEVVVEQPQMVYDGPYSEVLHPKLFVPHPHYKNIQQMPAVFAVYKRSVDYLREMQQRGVYRNVGKIGWARAGSYGEDSSEAFAKSLEIEGGIELEAIESERMAPDVDVLECYGRYIFPEDEVPYDVDTGIAIKGKESEAICHIGNYKTVLSIQKNPYHIRPFFDVGCVFHPELFWDQGLIRLGKDLQEQYDNLANLRFQNAMMAVNQMIKVRADADIDPAALIWKPFGLIPVEQMDDVEPMQTADITQTGVFREQEQFFENVLSEMTGMTAYNLGMTPDRQERVGVVHSLQSMGEARVRLMLMTMDYTGFRPFLKYMMVLNSYHLRSDFEVRISNQGQEQFTPLFAGDIHPDYDFTARYTAMEPALGKMFRAQQLMQLAQVWQQDPSLQQYEWKKAILELHDIPPEKMLKSPEQMAQEQQQMAQQMAQQQMQMMAMNAQMQNQLAEANDQRDLQKIVTKELLK